MKLQKKRIQLDNWGKRNLTFLFPGSFFVSFRRRSFPSSLFNLMILFFLSNVTNKVIVQRRSRFNRRLTRQKRRNWNSSLPPTAFVVFVAAHFIVEVVFGVAEVEEVRDRRRIDGHFSSRRESSFSSVGVVVAAAVVVDEFRSRTFAGRWRGSESHDCNKNNHFL